MTSYNKWTLKVLIICLSYFAINKVSAQNKTSHCLGFQDTLLHKFVYSSADQMPAPVGGINLFFNQLAKQLRLSSSEEQIMTHFVAAFVIEKNGTIDGTRFIRGHTADDHDLGKRILAFIKNSNWHPALCHGKRVPFLYVLPFNVELEE